MTKVQNTSPRPGHGLRRNTRLAAALLGALAITASGATLAAVGQPELITYQQNGIGVVGNAAGNQVPNQINHDYLGKTTEALAVDFGAEAITATVEVSNLFSDENGGERGQWEAFDAGGQPVGTGMIELPSDNVGSFDIVSGTDTTGPFRYLVFTALPYEMPTVGDSSDYFIRSISFRLSAEDEGTTVGGTPATEDAWSAVSPSGFPLGVAYTSGGRFVDAPIVIEPELCEGGDGDGSGSSCEVQLSQGVTLIIQNSPDISGTLAVNASGRVEDPRAACRTDGGLADSRIQSDGSLNLGFDLSNSETGMFAGETGPVIPATLCGQPDGAGGAFFNLLDLNSDLQISRSVLELVFETDPGSPFQCTDAESILASADPAQRRSELPVATWLPKTSRLEIPVLDADGKLVTDVQDQVFACGSTRTKFSRLSYVAYNLRYVPGTDYVAVISDEIAQIKTTIKQIDAGNCIDRRKEGLLNLSAAAIAYTFDRRAKYALAKLQLLGLLALVESSAYEAALEQCLFDPDTNGVMGGGPDVPDGMLARNFGGDLKSQISHSLYMIDRMLGVLRPRLPSSFD